MANTVFFKIMIKLCHIPPSSIYIENFELTTRLLLLKDLIILENAKCIIFKL